MSRFDPDYVIFGTFSADIPGHFDPKIHKLFLDHYDEFVALHKELKG